MLLLTDQAAGMPMPLDSMGQIQPVKSGLTAIERTALDLLAGVFPNGVRPAAGRVSVEDAPRNWLALALVESVDFSQYDIMLEMTRAAAALPGPLAAVALDGRNFHGNRGRPWRASRGNLHLSCAVPVDLEAGKTAAIAPALAAVSVCDALRRCAPGLEPSLKWVNDILFDGAKFAGVLSGAQTRGRRLLSLVFGIGVNVAVAPEVTPTVFVPRVTCLADHPAGRAVTVGMLALALLDALQARIGEVHAVGPQPVVSAYRRICGDIGRPVAVWAEGAPDANELEALPPPIAAGRCLGLTDDLSLIVEGASCALNSGRLAHLDQIGRFDPDAPSDAQEPGP